MTCLRMACAGLLAALLLPGLAPAALNDTGITQCANETQNNLPCPQAGFPSQDAETGRDAQQTAGTLIKVGGGSAGFDFTKLDSGGNPLPANATAWDCVRDNVTGRVWEVKTDDNSLRDKDWTYTWYNPDPATNGGNAGSQGSNTCGGTLPSNQCNTQAYVAAVNARSPALCGYTDWRLPTVEELRGIADHSRLNPAIDAAYFPRTVFTGGNTGYWSASPYGPLNVGNAWYVIFYYGYANYSGKAGSFAVRLVRGGQPQALETTPTSDFTLDDGNGTAYHQTTGLTWKRCVEGQSWDSVNKTCTGTGTGYTWSEALGLASGGWRLPNLKELVSIVERRGVDPTINATVFPNTPSYGYWSASPEANNRASHAWCVSFDIGFDCASYKVDLLAVRLVRGEPWFGVLGAGRVATSGGASFSILNNVSGTVTYATGLNSSGQLGAGPLTGTSTSAVRPQAFVFRRIYPVRVYWSARRTGRSPTATVPLAATDTPNFITIASATAHTVALRDDGTVWAWGDNANGQLGNGTKTPVDQPTPVLSDSSGTPLSGVVAIAAGRDHSVAVKSDGTVWTWGSNAHGQLGDNSDATTTRLYPVPVQAGAAALTGVRQVAASDVHTVALKTDGTVWAWGRNAGGYLGTGGDPTVQRTAVAVPGLTAVQAIQARGTDQSARTLAQRSDGLWGWGDNRQCQLGDTVATLGNTTTPVRLTNLSALGVGLDHLAQGDVHGLARKNDGTVWGWGGNAQGQVGDGTTTTQCAPVPVAGLSNVETVGAGADHSLVTLRDGTVFGWGNNDQGQLGVNDTTSRVTPTTAMKGEDNTGTLDLKPTVTYSLTLTTTGTGSGTVGGAGDYAAGVTVTLTATPNAGSTFAGWSPSPCAASFAMPANALTCTATFTAGTALPGDVNGDGKVDALDVVAVINAVLGIQPLPAADVNKDGSINALDVVFVINQVLGL